MKLNPAQHDVIVSQQGELAQITAERDQLKQQLAQAQAALLRVEEASGWIHPKSWTTAEGVTTQRTERQTGWNDAMMKVTEALGNELHLEGWLSSDEAKALQADAAAMRDALETGHIVNAFREDRTVAEQIKDNESRRIKALSTTAGRSLLERLERYERALVEISAINSGAGPAANCWVIATQALKGDK